MGTEHVFCFAILTARQGGVPETKPDQGTYRLNTSSSEDIFTQIDTYSPVTTQWKANKSEGCTWK